MKKKNKFNRTFFNDNDSKFDDNLVLQKRNAIIDYVNNSRYSPMKRKQLAIMLCINYNDLDLFNYVIDKCIKDSILFETKKQNIIGYKAKGYYMGTFTSNSKGFGFVCVDEDDINDIFIPVNCVNGASHKDIVICNVIKNSSSTKRPEGEIINIVERGISDIVGTFQKCNGFGFVIPDDKRIAKDIFISRNNTKGAVDGHKVFVKITNFDTRKKKNPEGEVVEILGHINDPGVDILSIIKQFNLPVEFDSDIYDYIENIDEYVPIDEIKRRIDLRSIKTITIDGEDSKDLDDAISLDILRNGNFRLGVHIADVSHYVKENSPLDKEAFRRGTSVYLVDRVIPMLPHKLSNGICSLNPNEDRLTLSCIMEIDLQGNVVNSKIVETVINSDRRMTYTDVNKIVVDNDKDLIDKYIDISDMLYDMDKLREILSNKRKKRGSIDFDFNEAKILLDDKGKPIDIKPYERNNATNIIEEFMLICNETIAEHCYWQQLPFIFRNHESPDDEKLQKLQEFLKNFGYRIKGNNEKIHSKSIQQIIEDVYGKPEENIVSRVVLRSMQQAKYMATNIGHFGLASKYYCHFTSPIRRYPDLEIHRIIKESIRGVITPKRRKSLERKMPDIAKQCSLRERIAEDIERETNKLKMVEFMADKIGNVYEGVISGITNWGVYVELSNTVEGMIRINNITDDYYVFDEKNLRLVGNKSNKIYSLGQKVFIRVSNVDIELRNIDFVFTDENDIIDIF